MREYSLSCLGSNGFYRIAYTEWGEADNPRIVICVHGLTRNRHDFDHLAARLAGEFRVVAMDVAGRGDSEWLADKEDYRFGQYKADAAALIARVTAPPRVFASPDEVVSHLREACAGFGTLSDEQWQYLALHGSRVLGDGRLALNCDPDIVRGLRSGSALDMPRGDRLLEGVDLWPAWDRIRCPTLVLRGVESDVLTARIAAEMQTRGPATRLLELPGVGHAPALMDAAQIEPIRDFLRGA